MSIRLSRPSIEFLFVSVAQGSTRTISPILKCSLLNTIIMMPTSSEQDPGAQRRRRTGFGEFLKSPLCSLLFL